jgi:NAD(P)-dependent dehydrogenase (short-subunit alcohol dehydrogenase family)
MLPAEAKGVVVNILDQKVGRPNPDHFSYTAGKVALAGLTPALALALAPNIRVCGLSPGLTLPSGPQSEDDYARGAAATPLGITSHGRRPAPRAPLHPRERGLHRPDPHPRRRRKPALARPATWPTTRTSELGVLTESLPVPARRRYWGAPFRRDAPFPMVRLNFSRR